MATNLSPQIKFNVAVSVQGRLEAFKNSRADAQTQSELSFLKQMSEQGMSSSEQLAYRKAQLEKEQQRGTPDPSYIAEIQKSIATLNKQVRFEKVRKIYQDSQSEVLQGNESLQAHLTILQGQLASESDPDMQSELKTQILQAQKDIADNHDTLLTNQVTYAQKDKSLPLIDSTIAQIKTEKAKALGSGNDAKASAFDLQIQALQQSRVQIDTENRVTRLSIAKSKKASAVGYLQSINDELGQADTSTPVVIGGVSYASEQAYWQQQRDQYVSTNFFADLDKEYDGYIKTVSSINGNIPDQVMTNIQKDYTNFAQRPELAPYLSRLEQSRVGSLASAVDITAKSIKNSYVNDLDVTKAVTQLEGLQSKFGVSTTSYIQDVIQNFGQQRSQFVQGLYSTVNQLVQDGASYSSAVDQVLSSVNNKEGKLLAANVSNNDVATKSTKDLLSSGPQKTKDQLNTPNVTPTSGAPKTPVIPPTPAEQASAQQDQSGQTSPNGLQYQAPTTVPGTDAQPVNTPANQSANPASYTVAAGDTLSGIAKKLLGDASKYSQIFEMNKDVLTNPNQVKAGQTLKIPKL